MKIKHQHDIERAVHQTEVRALSGNEGGVAAAELNRRQGAFLRRVSLLGTSAAIIIALMGLLGYVPGMGLLGSIDEGYIPMAPSTAVSFMVLGGILLYITLLSVSGARLVFLGTLAALVSIFGMLEVAGYYTGMDLDFEDALVPSAGTLGDIPIARMSHATGAAFFLAGLAVLALVLRLSRSHAPDPRLGHCGGSLGALVLSISIIFCLAYLFGSPLLYGQGATVPMAPTTALAFLMLGCAMVGVAGEESFPVSLLAAAERTGAPVSARKRILFLILIMIGACAIVMTVMTAVLYRHDLQDRRQMLQVIAQSQARLIEAVARYDQIHTPGGSTEATLSQIIEAHEHYQSFGETGEFTLARRDGNLIVFILRHRHNNFEYPAPVDFNSELAEPMRRALKGMSGTFLGLDHRRQTVLAAYEPVVVLDLGIVVKMDLAEVYTPFLRSGLAAAAVGLMVILAGTVLFLRISNPIVERLEAYSRQLEIEIEERKRAEATLRSSEERLQAVVDNTTMVIYLKDTEGRYLLINRPFEALFHVTKDEVVGKTDYDLFPKETAVAFRSHDQAVLAADAPLEFEEYTPQDDGLHTYASVKFPLPDATGKTYAVCGISTDITGRKRLEDEKARLTDELHHAQKMEAIGQLASGVAHDFNNLLQVISAHAELTRDIVESDSDIAKSMASVVAAVDQATGVTRALLTFSRKSRAQKRSTDLCATVEQTMNMLQRTLPATIELVVDTDCEPVPWINADPTQVQQIILNLAVNARDAMPKGGTLRVSVSAPEFLPSKRAADGSEALQTKLELSDTGTGIPVAIRQRILEPFFTTKKSGQGTGLGLSIIHGIVEDHNAFLEVDSTEGAGSTFTVYFPCISPNPAVPEDINKVVVPVGKSELILLAEDNQQIRDIIAATLVSHGYQVVQAADGDEVIEIFKRKEQEIRLLLLDVDLPKQSGLAALQTIRAMGCRTAAILITGSTHNLPDEQLDEGTVVLPKPFSMNQLGSLVVEHFRQQSTAES